MSEITTEKAPPKKKRLTASFRKAVTVFIVVPVILASVAALIAVSSFSADLTSVSNASSAHTGAVGISSIVGEYISFLNSASKLDTVVEASKSTSEKEKAKAFVSAYAERETGITDILLTDTNGIIFMSHTGEDIAKSFRDPDLPNIASTPTPVSGFYEHSKFYCAKPVGESGYIIILADAALLPALESVNSGSGVFAVFDENENIVSGGNTGDSVLKDNVAAVAKNKEYDANADYNSYKRNGRFVAAGKITGTKWRWVSLEPESNTTPFTFGVFWPSFAVAAGVCLLNIIIMLVVSGSVFGPFAGIAEKMRALEGFDDADSPGKKSSAQYSQLKTQWNEILDRSSYNKKVSDIITANSDLNKKLAPLMIETGERSDFDIRYDFMSGLYDRSTFTKMLDSEINESHEAAVILVSIDDFKQINERFNHDFGDVVIRFTAAKLKSAVNRNGFAGRLGGDEFALCITGREQINILERFCTDITDELYKGFSYSVTDPVTNEKTQTQMNLRVSIGIAVRLSADKSGDDANALIAKADKDMYLTKKMSDF